jgi:peptidoglycan/LPS O-acetylase OafA/YrhL
MTGSPRAVSGQHIPALDGVRAIAILGVILYHLGFGWASGGYLGVDLFFVLSGFLITSLLVEEWCTSDRIRLVAFWGRRARRLLPALLLVLIAISLYAVVNGQLSSPTSGGAAIDLSGLRGDALATLFYVANWHAIFVHQSYFAQFSTPSPLQHTWSLAIEEQFYLMWPLVIVGLLKWSPKHWRSLGIGLCVLGALASAAAMAVLYHAGADPSRVYYGTDTRAFDLLMGAALAMVAAGRAQPGHRARSLLHFAAPAAAAVLGVFWATAGTASGMPTTGMFKGEFLVCAALAAVVIADVRQFDQGPLARLLSVGPLRWIGLISYGLYLWHWPIFVYLNEARTGLSGAGLDFARVGSTFAVATGSYYLLELPIRRRRYSGIPRILLAPSALLVTAVIVVGGTSPSLAAPPVLAWTGGGLYPGSGPHVPGAGGISGEVPIALPPGTVISHAHPLRVLTIGDSIMAAAERGIGPALMSTGEMTVTWAAEPGWSLEEPGGQAFLQRRVRETHAQLIIGTWSWDAGAAHAEPGAYQSTLDTVIRQLLSPADGHVLGVIFLQMPPFGPNAGYDDTTVLLNGAGIPAWNEAVQRASQTFPGKVMYLPVASSVEFKGRYSTWLPDRGRTLARQDEWARVRTLDDIHLCPPGLTRYAAPVLQDLTTVLHLSPPKHPWWNSYVIAVAGFDSATSSFGLACPPDHPPPSATN